MSKNSLIDVYHDDEFGGNKYPSPKGTTQKLKDEAREPFSIKTIYTIFVYRTRKIHTLRNVCSVHIFI